MSDPLEPRYCPVCHNYVAPHSWAQIAATGEANCPTCGHLLDPVDEPHGNPFGTALALKLVGAVARIMVKADVLAQLEAKAKESPSTLDDFAIRIVKALIEQAATL